MFAIKVLLAIIAIALLWMVGFWQWIFSLIGWFFLFVIAVIVHLQDKGAFIGALYFLVAIVITGVVISPLLLLFSKNKKLREMKISRPRLHDTILMTSAIFWVIGAMVLYFWISGEFK